MNRRLGWSTKRNGLFLADDEHAGPSLCKSDPTYANERNECVLTCCRTGPVDRAGHQPGLCRTRPDDRHLFRPQPAVSASSIPKSRLIDLVPTLKKR